MPFRDGFGDGARALAHGPTEQVRLVDVVGAAAELDVLEGGGSAPAVRAPVVALPHPTVRAPAAAAAHARAARAVPDPHRALDQSRDVARSRLRLRALAGPRGGGKLPSGQVLEEERQGAV